jgi:hypothetical protein
MGNSRLPLVVVGWLQVLMFTLHHQHPTALSHPSQVTIAMAASCHLHNHSTTLVPQYSWCSFCFPVDTLQWVQKSEPSPLHWTLGCQENGVSPKAPVS